MQAGEEGVIANLCKVHAYLLESDRVDPDDRALFAKLKSEKADRGQLVDSLQALIRMMYAHYGKPVILLIDEYDVPLAKAHDADKGGLDYYPKMLDTIRELMSSALKTNEYLQFAVITGCLRIAKESIFTGVNNFKTFGILDARFSDASGFTEPEVKERSCRFQTCQGGTEQNTGKEYDLLLCFVCELPEGVEERKAGDQNHRIQDEKWQRYPKPQGWRKLLGQLPDRQSGDGYRIYGIPGRISGPFQGDMERGYGRGALYVFWRIEWQPSVYSDEDWKLYVSGGILL